MREKKKEVAWGETEVWVLLSIKNKIIFLHKKYLLQTR